MLGYLVRRFIQMFIVVLISATASYALLNLAPGGPLSGLRQMQQSSRTRITAEDFARIRAYFELDLYLPVRFTRWLIGEPRGAIVIGNYEFFGNTVVGCRQTLDATDPQTGEIVQVGCKEYVRLRDLAGRSVSRGVLFLDFGNSWRLNRDRPVTDLILQRLPNTVLLMGLELIISLLLGIPLGVYSAVKQYSRFDYFFTTLAFMGSAMPTFFFGILMITIFSVAFKNAGLPYLPPGMAVAVRDYSMPLLGTVTAGSVLDRILHLIMPVSVLTLVSVSGWTRYVRGTMLEVLRQDYVRTARAKGLIERVVILKHALRNALIPFITVAVFSIPALFGGAIITESIFSWPGMGRLFIMALGEYDYPLAMAFFFIEAILVVFATLLADILYTIVDPRIRFS